MELGEYNSLTLLRFTSVGAYLGDEEDNDVLLPNKYLTEEMLVGEKVNVFLYKDSEDRIVATTETPKIKLREMKYLTVKEVNGYGAFLDWGLEKDLMVPFKEQTQRMDEGKSYLVGLRFDFSTDRLYATMKINPMLSKCLEKEIEGQMVDVLVCEPTDLGVKVIVNQKYHGLIFHNLIIKPINPGDEIKAYVHKLREDGKLDIRLTKEGYEKVIDSESTLLDYLTLHQEIMLTDKSSPEDIRELIGMSKKTFKQAVGKLYKERKVTLLEDRIALITS